VEQEGHQELCRLAALAVQHRFFSSGNTAYGHVKHSGIAKALGPPKETAMPPGSGPPTEHGLHDGRGETQGTGSPRTATGHANAIVFLQSPGQVTAQEQRGSGADTVSSNPEWKPQRRAPSTVADSTPASWLPSSISWPEHRPMYSHVRGSPGGQAVRVAIVLPVCGRAARCEVQHVNQTPPDDPATQTPDATTSGVALGWKRHGRQFLIHQQCHWAPLSRDATGSCAALWLWRFTASRIRGTAAAAARSRRAGGGTGDASTDAPDAPDERHVGRVGRVHTVCCWRGGDPPPQGGEGLCPASRRVGRRHASCAPQPPMPVGRPRPRRVRAATGAADRRSRRRCRCRFRRRRAPHGGDVRVARCVRPPL